jgi:hypothetical protein
MDPSQLASLVGANDESPAGGVGTDYAAALGYGAPPPSPAPQLVNPFSGTPGSPVADPQPTGPVTSPEQPTGESSFVGTLGTPAPLSVSAGTKVGVSQSGLNMGTLDKLQAKSKAPGGIRGELAKDQQQAQDEYQPVLAEGHAATEQAVTAANTGAAIESDRARILADGKAKLANAQQDFATKEQAATEQAQAEAMSSKASYKAALSSWAAMRVNPQDLWDNSGTAGQFSMIATAFMHDFLGAKGIQTSGMDSIRQAIQNNINAQIQNINHQGDVAKGFKELWEMQRAQSATDAEARQRVFGFYLKGLSDQVEAQASQYDSPLAKAKGMAAVAKLNQEQADNDLKVFQHIDTASAQRQSTAVQLYGHELAASSARYSADMAYQAKMAEINRKAAGKNTDGSQLLFDKSGTAYRRFLPDVEPKTKDDLRETSQKMGHTVDNLRRLSELQAQISSRAPGSVIPNNLYDEAQRAAEQLRNITKMGIIYDNSGKQINEQEIKLYDQMLAQKDWFLNGDNVRSLGILARDILEKTDAKAKGLSYEIGPEDPAYGFKSGDKQFDPAGSALADIQSAPGAGRHENTNTEKTVESLHSPDAFRTADPDKDPGAAGASAWHQLIGDTKFRESLPPLARNALRGSLTDRQPTPRFSSDSTIPKIQMPQDVPDNAFVQMNQLADAALAGDSEARSRLAELSRENSTITKIPGQDLLQAYAIWEESRVHDVLSRTGKEPYTDEEAARAAR